MDIKPLTIETLPISSIGKTTKVDTSTSPAHSSDSENEEKSKRSRCPLPQAPEIPVKKEEKISNRGIVYRVRVKANENPEWLYFDSLKDCATYLNLTSSQLSELVSKTPDKREHSYRNAKIHNIQKCKSSDYDRMYSGFILALTKYSKVGEEEAKKIFYDHIYQ